MQNNQKRNEPLPFKIIVIVCVAFGLSACKPKTEERALSFETIEQREWSSSGKNYEPREPGMVIIAQREETNGLDGMVSDESIKQLQTLDYDQYFALAAFQGWKPETGYGIQLNRIVRLGNTVNVYAQLYEPKPNEPRGAMETSPYHVVKVQKSGSWNQNITFNLLSDDKLVASLAHTIP